MRPVPRFAGTHRFRIVRQLGQGGMGVVYEALDTQRGMPVALKTLYRLDPEELYRLKAEFRSLADVQHPNLVRLDELCCEDGEWFFTMELIRGVGLLGHIRGHQAMDAGEPDELPLADTLTGGTPGGWIGAATSGGARPSAAAAARGTCAEDRLRAALRQLALAVSAIHGAGKLHRDIKPSNVLVTAGDRVVLLDFGMVTGATPAEQADDAALVGTIAYMAPEQAACRPVGPAADWYSFGVILYQVLTGRLPHQGSLLSIMIDKQHSEPPPARDLAPGVPRDLDELAADLLRRDPASRPSGEEVQARLGARPASERRRRAASASQLPPFVGRGAQLGALGRAFDEMSAGRHVSLLVLGESGVGKSALVRRFCDQLVATEPAALVLEGRCYEKESVPYKAFDEIIDALSRHLLHLDPGQAAAVLPEGAGHLGRLFPVLGRVPLVQRAPPRQLLDVQQVRNQAMAALREMLAALRRRRPLVIVIDDFQWADADSIVLLRELIHPPAPPLMLVVAARTARDGGGPVGGSALEALPPSTRRIDLASLEPREAEELATRLMERVDGPLGVSPTDVAREARGHPLFLQEIVRFFEIGGAPERDLRLDEALFARVSRLAPADRRLLEVVAIAGEPMAQSLVARAAGLDPPEAHRSVAHLRGASLVMTTGTTTSDLIEPYHDRVREALLEHLDPAARVAHHAAWARVLEADGGVSEALVRHLQAAGDRAGAAVQAEAAAARAAGVLAFDCAARLYRIALDLGRHDPSHRRGLLVSLAEALEAGGRGREAAAAYLEAADAPDAALRRDCQRRAAEQLLICGHIEEGMKALADLLAEVGARLPRRSRSALASLIWERLRLRLTGLRWRERGEQDIGAAELLQADIHRAVSVGLAMVDTIRGAAFQAKATRLSLRLGEKRRICLALATEAGFVATSGKLHAVDRLIEPAAAIAAALRDPLLVAYMHAVRGVSTYLAGQFHRGREECTRALDMMTQETVGTTFERNTLRYFQIASLMHMGRFVELHRLLDDYLRDAERRGDRYLFTSLTRVVSHAWLTGDDPAAMRRRLSSTDWVPPAGVYHLQHFYDFRAATDLALYEGTLSPDDDGWRRALADLRRSHLLSIEIQRNETDWLLGRIFLAQAARDRRAPLARAARIARRLAARGCPYASSWAHLIGAGAANLCGDRARAAAELRLARAAAATAGQELALACARRRLGDLLGPGRGDADAAAASAWFEREGVTSPARMCAVIAPGFPP